MNSLLILSIAFAFLAALSTGTDFTDCGSTTGTVSAVSVSNCPDGLFPCPLTKGTNATIGIEFTSKADSKSLKTVVHGIIAAVPIPFPVPQPDGCKLGVSCPITNGQKCAYSAALLIRRSYPPVDVTVRYELKDEENKDMACVEIKCKIEN